MVGRGLDLVRIDEWRNVRNHGHCGMGSQKGIVL